jgi:PhoPQ-activated pathogenicity-related protein
MHMGAGLLLGACLLLGVVLATPLDDYVNAPDPSYKWVVNSTIPGATFTAYNLRLTSQTWMTYNETNWPTWEHWLVVCVPNEVLTTTAFMYIDGGRITDPPPTSVYPPVELLCLSGSIGVHLQTIPNEPIIFENDGIRRTEDALIAYTWAHFFNHTNEPIWLARLPMTKAAVKAMDAVQEFTNQTLQLKDPIDSFIVGGASKRGWTTWTTGAVDKRVIAIVPIVMPILNIVPNMGHQYQCYGEWSFALGDYLNEGCMAYLNDQQFLDLAAIVDPYSYLHRLTMPKYMITSAGDEFFLPDSPQFFIDALQGPKFLRVVPDAEHSLIGHELDLTFTIATFFHLVVDKRPIPTISWNFTITPEGTGVITATSDVEPTEVLMFHATTISTTRRDFRLITCGAVNASCIQPILWFPTTLSDQGGYTYVATMDPPEKGWKAFMIQFDFEYPDHSGGMYTFKQSTEAHVIPNTLPFPPCGNHCQPPHWGQEEDEEDKSIHINYED